VACLPIKTKMGDAVSEKTNIINTIFGSIAFFISSLMDGYSLLFFACAGGSLFHLIYGIKTEINSKEKIGYLIASSSISFIAAFLMHQTVFFTSLFNGSIRANHAAAAIGVAISMSYPYIIELLQFSVKMFKKYIEIRVKK
jgi:hypothetical protein